MASREIVTVFGSIGQDDALGYHAIIAYNPINAN